MTVVGIDPGSRSWSVVMLEPNSTYREVRFSSNQIKHQSSLISDLIKTYDDIQMMVVPSGYGFSLKSLNSLTDDDFKLLTLKHHDEPRVLGLTDVLIHLQSVGIHGFVIPGVIHLPTVPKYRKYNRLDMGTPDKVCSVVAAIIALSSHSDINWNKCSFVMVEAGSAFTAVIGVQNGKIVDGIGGSEGCIGYQARGGMDGEYCYLLGDFQKNFLYRGGFIDIIGKFIDPSKINNKFIEIQTNNDGWSSLIEETAKDVISMALSCNPDYVVLSGSLAENSLFSKSLQERLNPYLQIEFYSLQQFSNAKGAALGAAYLADGLSGGIHSGLVDLLELKQASGTCLDYLDLRKELEANL